MKLITDILDYIKANVPVDWDRYTLLEGTYAIYGWIKRTDGNRDFILLNLEIDEENKVRGGFTTSSAKYGKILDCLIFPDKKNYHSHCIKIDELYNREQKVQVSDTTKSE